MALGASLPRRLATLGSNRRRTTGETLTSFSDRAVESVILTLLDQRSPGASICPSEAARALRPGPGDGWRDLMEPVRRAAGRLADAGLVVTTQRGVPVDALRVRGPLRIRRP
ncbi:DUF3253 domain-containing protein [Streptomyces sp. NPDC002574]|uniref:DUF3253 domain-containing protein n=1 Tax=Streptomyces sp. NPDC002574 TaxID=3364652 RepID=UPI0036AF6110